MSTCCCWETWKGCVFCFSDTEEILRNLKGFLCSIYIGLFQYDCSILDHGIFLKNANIRTTTARKRIRNKIWVEIKILKYSKEAFCIIFITVAEIGFGRVTSLLKNKGNRDLRLLLRKMALNTEKLQIKPSYLTQIILD